MIALGLAVLVICIMVSTKETRAAGAEAVRPFARWAGIIVVVIWGAVFLLPHGIP